LKKIGVEYKLRTAKPRDIKLGRDFALNRVNFRGFFARPCIEIDWHTVDSDLTIEKLETIDTRMSWRATAQIIASY
jgi:hypothetical protein